MQQSLSSVDATEPGVADRLLAIQRAAYRIEADLIGFEGIPQLHETADDLSEAGLSWRAVTENGEVIAAVGYEVEGGTCDIDRLVVDPPHHRRGLATMLVVSLMEYDRITVSTGTANTPARRFYRSLGFVEIATREVAPGVSVTALEWTAG